MKCVQIRAPDKNRRDSSRRYHFGNGVLFYYIKFSGKGGILVYAKRK